MPERIPGVKLSAAERRNEIVEYRRKRMSFDEIGKKLGLSRQRAHAIYSEAVASIPAANVEEHRKEMLAQLDEAERVCLEILNKQHWMMQVGKVVRDEDGKPIEDPAPRLQAAKTLTTIQSRKSALLGADSAVKVEHGGEVRFEIVGVDPSDLV